MSNKADCELIRVNLKNIENANKLYSELIERILQRIESRERGDGENDQ